MGLTGTAPGAWWPQGFLSSFRREPLLWLRTCRKQTPALLRARGSRRPVCGKSRCHRVHSERRKGTTTVVWRKNQIQKYSHCLTPGQLGKRGRKEEGRGQGGAGASFLPGACVLAEVQAGPGPLGGGGRATGSPVPQRRKMPEGPLGVRSSP